MEDFVTYEQAIKLKQLGFDKETDYVYMVTAAGEPTIFLSTSEFFNASLHKFCNEYCFAPTLAQAQKWLREVKNIYVFSNKAIAFPSILKGKFYWEIINQENERIAQCYSCDLKDTYEEALLDGIDKAIQILK